MTEHDMEELLWKYPDRLLNEPLEPFRKQPSSQVGRADLIFKDRLGRFLVVEIKKGVLPRGAVNQLVDYYGMLKREFQNESVELMAVANSIPEDRAIACLKYDIEPREISEKRFADLACEVGYELDSERDIKNKAGRVDLGDQVNTASSRGPRPLGGNRVERAWYFSPSGLGKPTFLAFVNAKGNSSMRVFDADDGSFLGRRADGDYREAFREYIQSATSVTVAKQPSLEKECKQQLPAVVLSELKRQRH
jgi:hypothetical protein